MDDNTCTLQQIKQSIHEFIQERDWENFHDPKNLSMSVAIESSELMENFQWLTTEESRRDKLTQVQLYKIEEEIADIGIYLIDLCNVLGIDLSLAIQKKLEMNACKYPTELVKGKPFKYSEY